MMSLIPKIFRVFCLTSAMYGISAWQDTNTVGRAYALLVALFLVWTGLYLFKDDPNAHGQH